jgi:hypothetical protein
VVVYCWDALCDVSPRAAVRLEQLGFEVYDYGLSKVDWMTHGLPMEGTAAPRSTALSLARQDVVTCALDDSAQEIKERVDASPYRFALVLASRVVLGRIRRTHIEEGPDDASAEVLMEPGPSTTRPHTDPGELAARLQRSGARTAILTTPQRELMGAVRRGGLPNPAEGSTT